jgi:hypothetical protein
LAALAVVRDLRDVRAPVSAEDLEQFETDALAGFVLARASAGLADGTIRGDVGNLDQMRSWFGLHRHFSDFYAFLADLVLDCAAQLETQASALRESAGTGTVADNLTNALTTLFGPIPVAIIPLITFRDELRARLRQVRPGGGIAILAQATTAISAYLADERELGRIAADADIDSLTFSLVGGGHLLFADRDPGPPATTVVNKLVTAVITDSVQRRPA